MVAWKAALSAVPRAAQKVDTKAAATAVRTVGLWALTTAGNWDETMVVH